MDDCLLCEMADQFDTFEDGMMYGFKFVVTNSDFQLYYYDFFSPLQIRRLHGFDPAVCYQCCFDWISVVVLSSFYVLS